MSAVPLRHRRRLKPTRAQKHALTVARARRLRRRLAGTPFLLLMLALLAAGLSGLLALNTAAAQDSFRLHQLQQRSAALSDEEQQLHVALLRQADPFRLDQRARAAGLVPAGDVRFLRLPAGR